MLSDPLGIERAINEIMKDDGYLALDRCNYVSELLAYELPKHFVILEKEEEYCGCKECTRVREAKREDDDERS